jgi:GR25 family glycosyltransferase involved in LPS biosynthesis
LPPIYVINLERRPDRLARVTRLLAAAGLGFTRIDAIDAKSVDPAWLDAQFAAPDEIGALSAAEQACALSHFEAYRRFAASPAGPDTSHAVILEDDAHLAETAGGLLACLDWLPKDQQLLKLERSRPEVMLAAATPVAGSSRIARLCCDHTSSAGYIISRPLAEALAAMTPRPRLMIDFLLFHPVYSPLFRRMRPAQLLPALVEQETPDDGDIGAGRMPLMQARLRPAGAARLRREWLRLMNQARRRTPLAVGGARWTRIDFTPAEPDPIPSPGPPPSQAKERVVVFQTHRVDEAILASYRRLARDLASDYEVYFLLHGERRPDDVGNSVSVANSDLLTLPYDEKIDRRHLSIVPGNADLLLLAFRRKVAARFYWVIEYDAHFSGDWREFVGHFDRRSDADLLASTLFRRSDTPAWPFWETLKTGDDTVPPRRQARGFLPVYRVSDRLLDLADKCYRRGWAGHYETVLPTLALCHGLQLEDFGGDGPFTRAENLNRFYWNTPTHWSLSPGTLTYRPVMTSPPAKLVWPLSRLARRRFEAGKLWHPVKDERPGRGPSAP